MHAGPSTVCTYVHFLHCEPPSPLALRYARKYQSELLVYNMTRKSMQGPCRGTSKHSCSITWAVLGRSLGPVGESRRVQQPFLTTTSVEKVDVFVKTLQSEKGQVITKTVKLLFSFVFFPSPSFFPSQRGRSRYQRERALENSQKREWTTDHLGR